MDFKGGVRTGVRASAAVSPHARSKRDLPLVALGLRPGLTAAAPAHVLLLDRQQEDVPTTGRRTPVIEALHGLVAQSSSTWLVECGLWDALPFADAVAVGAEVVALLGDDPRAEELLEATLAQLVAEQLVVRGM